MRHSICWCLLALGADGTVRVWSIKHSHVLREYPPPPAPPLSAIAGDSGDTYSGGAVSALSLSPDGALLASSLTNSISFYDTRKFLDTPSSSR